MNLNRTTHNEAGLVEAVVATKWVMQVDRLIVVWVAHRIRERRTGIGNIRPGRVVEGRKVVHKLGVGTGVGINRHGVDRIQVDFQNSGGQGILRGSREIVGGSAFVGITTHGQKQLVGGWIVIHAVRGVVFFRTGKAADEVHFVPVPVRIPKAAANPGKARHNPGVGIQVGVVANGNTPVGRANVQDGVVGSSHHQQARHLAGFGCVGTTVVVVVGCAVFDQVDGFSGCHRIRPRRTALDGVHVNDPILLGNIQAPVGTKLQRGRAGKPRYDIGAEEPNLRLRRGKDAEGSHEHQHAKPPGKNAKTNVSVRHVVRNIQDQRNNAAKFKAVNKGKSPLWGRHTGFRRERSGLMYERQRLRIFGKSYSSTCYDHWRNRRLVHRLTN